MNELIYLDNSATTFPKPDCVHDAVRDFYRSYGVNPGRTGCELAMAAEKMIHSTRQRLSRMFNGSLYEAGNVKDPNRLCFTLNGTMALNMIINGSVEPGDHIVTSKLEHNAVIRPVNHRVQLGAQATYVAPDGEGYLDPDDIRKAIQPNTKLVIINHGSNVIGTLQDIKAIGAICREREIPFAIDAAQTAGVVPIDMAECHISFLAFTGHKGLFAPTGTGGLCVADDANLKCTLYGGTGVRSAVPYHPEEYPYHLEAGTQNLAGIAGLSAGLDWIEQQGMDNILTHEMALLERLQDGLATIPGVRIHGTTNLENRLAAMAVTVDNYDASDIGMILDMEFSIQTRTGLQCAPLIHELIGTAPRGSVRFSIGPFNTEEQIDTTIKAIEEISADRNAPADSPSKTATG